MLFWPHEYNKQLEKEQKQRQKEKKARNAKVKIQKPIKELESSPRISKIF